MVDSGVADGSVTMIVAMSNVGVTMDAVEVGSWGAKAVGVISTRVAVGAAVAPHPGRNKEISKRTDRRVFMISPLSLLSGAIHSRVNSHLSHVTDESPFPAG